MERRIITVSELNEYIKMVVENDELLMRIFTNDGTLIAIGSDYLRIVGVSYLFMGISQVYLCIMRSIERVVFAMTVFGSALILNIFLNAVFIFGLFGMPRMGAAGAGLVEYLLCTRRRRLGTVRSRYFPHCRRQDCPHQYPCALPRP